MTKTVKYLEVEIELLKNIQIERTLEMKNLGTRIGTSEASLITRIKDILERMSGIEDTIESLGQKKCQILKKNWYKIFRKSGML